MLYLIGTSHMDLKCYDGLSGLLNKLNPSWVGIEETKQDYETSLWQLKQFSKKSVFEKSVNLLAKTMCDKQVNLETVRLWLSSAYGETRAVSEYCNSRNIEPVYCEDSSNEMDEIFNVQVKNPDSSLNTTFSEFFRMSPEEAFRDVAQEYLMGSYPVADSKSLTAFYTKRDKFAADTLRKQSSDKSEDGVYICGLDHIFGDYYPNLFDRLSDLNPTRMKLDCADKI